MGPPATLQVRCHFVSSTGGRVPAAAEAAVALVGLEVSLQSHLLALRRRPGADNTADFVHAHQCRLLPLCAVMHDRQQFRDVGRPFWLTGAHSHTSLGRWHDLGWRAVIVQFIGATLFEVSVIVGTPHVLPAESDSNYGTYDVLYWSMQVRPPALLAAAPQSPSSVSNEAV